MKILIVQTAFLGDAVLSSPVVSALASRFPDAERWLMVTPTAAMLYRGDPRLAGVLSFDKRGVQGGFMGMVRQASLLRSHGFDVVYSLHRSFRTSLLLALARIPVRVGFSDATGAWLYTDRRIPLKGHHAVERLYSLIADREGGREGAPALELPVPQIDRVAPVVREVIEGRPYTLLFPGSVWATKRWWPAHYQKLIQSLSAAGERCVVLGSREERPLAEEITRGTPALVLAGSCSIPETSLLVKHAKKVVCNDSMALHLASTFKVPTVAIFCATSPDFGFGPWQNSRARVVEKKGLECRPCARHGGHQCPTGTNACMKELLPEEVAAVCREVGAND